MRLIRCAAALLLALFALQAVGAARAANLPCAETCADDGPDGQCAPTCEDCLCCTHARATFAPPAPLWLPVEAGRLAVGVPDGSPPEAEAQEILHIPKLHA